MADTRYQVTAESLNLRNEPSFGNEVTVLDSLSKGTEVKLISLSDDNYWYKVETPEGLVGWASHKYLQAVVEPADDNEFPWMLIARAEIGVKEFSGSADNPRILEYLHSTNLAAPYRDNDETHWCSGFVNWCIERAGIEGTDSAWARSWLNWGKKIQKPVPGCIVVLKRGKKNGHVGFYIGESNTKVELLGGNQGNQVSLSGFPKSDLLGYRLPGTFV